MQSTKKKDFKISSGRSLSKGRAGREVSQKSLEPHRATSGLKPGTHRTPAKATTVHHGSKRISIDGRTSFNKFQPAIHELDNMDKYLEKHLIEVGKTSQKDSGSQNNDDGGSHLSHSGHTPPKSITVTNRKLVKGSTFVLEQPQQKP